MVTRNRMLAALVAVVVVIGAVIGVLVMTNGTDRSDTAQCGIAEGYEPITYVSDCVDEWKAHVHKVTREDMTLYEHVEVVQRELCEYAFTTDDPDDDNKLDCWFYKREKERSNPDGWKQHK